MEIHGAARRHGIDPADIEHVVAHPLAVVDEENDEGVNQVLYLGWNCAGDVPLEVVVLHFDDGRDMAIHAMKMRASYERYLPGGAMPETYGTSGEVEITDALVERLADRAERGFDHARLRPRGRPPMGAAAAKVTQVRLPPELSEALARRAARDRAAPSEVIRRALRRYLEA